ncbi:MAG: twin-arginine translocation pathway signal [Pseudomonadota bacterium]
MTTSFLSRRRLLATGAVALAAPAIFSQSVLAQSQFAPTQTMRGGSNNYSPNAPFVESLGTGFLMSGMVRLAGSGAPLSNVRIQIWAATTLGGEREPRNHGSVLTGSDGSYRLEMMQIVPNFGEPHAHLAYDDGAFQTVFLRPVMPSARDTSLTADFNLQPA